MGSDPFKTREPLTYWSHVQRSAILISGSNYQNINLTHSLDAYSVNPISCSNLVKHRKAAHKLDVWFLLVILIRSNTGKLTRWMQVQLFLSVVLIFFNGWEKLTTWICQPFTSVAVVLLKYWSATHILNMCSSVLISNSHLLKHWRTTHFLNACSNILVSGSESDLLQAKHFNLHPRCISS